MNTLQQIFPLPFGILSLFALSLLSWAITLHLLRPHFNPNYLLQQPPATLLHPPVYHASLSLSLLILFGMACNLLLTNLNLIHPSYSQFISSLPAFFLLAVPFRLAPFSHHFRSTHRKFHSVLKRIFLFNLPPQSPTLFSDVIFADLLTSLARPFAHLALFLSSLIYLNSNIQSTLSVALNCLPYLLRFKQCVNDAIIGPERTKSIMNAVKYATAIPTIILSSEIKNLATRIKNSDSNHHEYKERNSKLNLWILASFINSIYSTWWDIVYDWGLNSFSNLDCLDRVSSLFKKNQFKSDLIPLNRHHHHHYHHQHSTNPQGRILFNQKTLWPYLIVIIINLTLRMSWIPGVFMGPDKIGVKLEYTQEVLEVIRRWIWCLIRLEWAEINRNKDNDFYLDLNTSSHQLDSSIDNNIDRHEIDLFHKINNNQDVDLNNNDDDDDDEKLSDGPILDLHHHFSTTPPLSNNDFLIKPSSSISSSPSQNHHLEFNKDFKLLQKTP